MAASSLSLALFKEGSGDPVVFPTLELSLCSLGKVVVAPVCPPTLLEQPEISVEVANSTGSPFGGVAAADIDKGAFQALGQDVVLGDVERGESGSAY